MNGRLATMRAKGLLELQSLYELFEKMTCYHAHLFYNQTDRKLEACHWLIFIFSKNAAEVMSKLFFNLNFGLIL